MKRTIMVVEDDPTVLQALTGILALDNWDVVATSAPDPVSQIAASVAPDVFLIDLMLPGISGVEVAAELREGAFRDTPMIGISGSFLLREVAQETGLFQAVLEKPLDFDLLISSIEEFAPA